LTVASGVPLCGQFSGTIPMSLQGRGITTVPNFALEASDSLGSAPCAVLGGVGQAASESLAVVNETGASGAAIWTASLSGLDASFFTLSSTTGSVAAEMPGTFKVSVPAFTSASGLSARQAAFGIYATVTVDVGGTTFVVPVTFQPIGEYPKWSVASLAVQKGIPTPFSLMNLSRSGGTVTLTPSNASFLVATHGGDVPFIQVPCNATVTDDATGADAGSTITASFAEASTPLCGPIPAPLVVTGP